MSVTDAVCTPFLGRLGDRLRAHARLGPSVLVLMGAVVPPEARGTGTGLLQLCGDVGAMLGPLVGTTLFADSISLPYLLTAALVACFIPVAFSLASIERKTQEESAWPSPPSSPEPHSSSPTQ